MKCVLKYLFLLWVCMYVSVEIPYFSDNISGKKDSVCVNGVDAQLIILTVIECPFTLW